ncbi:MAG TPA: pitrilysin family protein [Burkholderiales bacterium]|nr:pitrilysin family protein [Burkholderiales bacterium]
MPLSRLAAVRSCALALILAGMTSLSLGANAPAAAPGATKDSKPAVTGLAADAVSAPAVPAGVSRVTSVEGITEYRLANGLQVLLLPDPSVDTATVAITYRVGSRNEGYGESGMAHLLEHMLFKGSPRHRDVKGEIQARGARFNGSTSNDRTNYYETFPASEANLSWAIDLEADRMLHSFVAKKDLDSEMTVVRNEFESGENSPYGILRERVAATAYLWHGYGRAIIGARSDIENVPIERLQAFYRLYYQPDNATLVIAGRFDPATALKLVAQHFGPMPRPARALPATYTVEPTQDGERTVSLRRVGDVQLVSALYHIPPGPDPEYAAVDVLVELLSNVPTGRLQKALVVPGKASFVFGSERQLREAGYAYFGASVPQSLPLDAARATLLATLEGFAANPVTEEEVQRARTRLLNETEMLLADSRALALALSETIAMGDWRMLFLHRDRLKKVTAEEVQRAALRYLKTSNRTVGEFIPTQSPDRAEIPPVPDVAAMLQGYRGDTATAQGEAFDPTPANIEARTRRVTLPNGMTLALMPKKTRGGTVVADIGLRWGDEQSKRGRATACGMASAMLMRGTEFHNREQLANEFTRLKASVGVGTEGGSIETVRDSLPAALRLVAEVLRHPAFAESEFQQLRLSSLASIESQKSEPGALAGLALRRHLEPFPAEHWYYNATPEERITRLKNLTLDEVKQCYRDFIGASHAEMAVVGDFDPDEITRLAGELFGDWKTPAPYARIAVPYRSVAGMDHLIETPDKANAVLRGGMAVPIRDDDPDYPALVLANYLLGGNSAARLSARIREQAGLSYSVGSSMTASSFDRRGEFSVFAIYAPQNRARVDGMVKEELRRALTEGFTREEVETGKKGLLQARQVARNSDSGLAGRLLTYLVIGRTMAWDQQLEKRIAELTPQEMLDTMRKYWSLDRYSVVEAGDFKSSVAAAGSSGSSNANNVR